MVTGVTRPARVHGDSCAHGLGTRRGAVRRLGLLALVALVLAGLGAPVARALPAGEGSSTSETRAAARAVAQEEREKRRAEKRERAEQNQRERRERLAQLRAEREQKSGTKKPIKNGVLVGEVSITCSQVTWHYFNFPEAKNNTVTEIVFVDGARPYTGTFTFDGSHGSNTTPIAPPAGAHRIDARGKWDTNGYRSGFDIGSHRTCGHEFSIEKRQSLAGVADGYSPAPLTAQVGQTINYEIVISNTGTVPLTFGSFSDPRCDPGTLTGGPGKLPLQMGQSAKYFCTHKLTAADGASYTNTASITGTPEPGNGEPETKTSNTVVVNIPSGGGTKEPPKENPKEDPKGSSAGSGVGASQGQLSTISSQPKQGALAAIARVPGLVGPQGCVRGSFVVSVKAPNVRSVTFYLDGHRLKTLTARSARRGTLSIRINAAHLRVGAHRLLAKITMVPTAASVKAVVAKRSLTFVRCNSPVLTPKFTG